MIQPIYFATVIVCIAFTKLAFAKDEILWGVGNQPPRLTYSVDGKLGGQGGIQQNILTQELAADYDAKYIQTNWARFEAEVKRGAKMCSSFLVKTSDRMDYIAFSIPWHIDLPHRIVMHRHTWKSQGFPSQLSLKAIMTNEDLKGFIEKGRSYGNLDKLLKNPESSSNINVLSIRPAQGLGMLNKHRMDYTLEYPYFTSYFQQQHKSEEELVSIPISEGQEYLYTYVGCPNTIWGRQVIQKVNKIIEKVRPRKDYLDILTMLYSKDSDKQLVEQIYRESFINEE